MSRTLVIEPLYCSQGGIPYNKAHLDAKDAEIERLRAVICDALDDEVARRFMSKWCAEAMAALGYDPALKDTTP